MASDFVHPRAFNLQLRSMEGRKMWKLFCAFAIVLVIVAGKPTSNSLSEDFVIIKACNETSPVSLEVLNVALVHRKLTEDTNYGFKCFLHCLYTKYGWMDDVGGFELSTMKHVLEAKVHQKDVLRRLLFRCTTLVTTDRCERAFKYTECFWDEMKRMDEASRLYDAAEPNTNENNTLNDPEE